jgi:AraC-like DNA-binding protein
MIGMMAHKNGMNPGLLSISIAPGVKALTGGVFISPGFGLHPERIPNDWELIVVERGQLGLAVGDHIYDLTPSSWILMPAGIKHFGTVNYLRNLRFLWIHFQPNGDIGKHPLTLPATGVLTDPVSIMASMRRLIDHFSENNFDQRVADCLVALILSELAIKPEVAEAGDELAHRALRHIRARFREQFTGYDLAKSLRVSLDHLSRRFKKAHGCRIAEAINRERLNEASRLMLLGGGISLAEIALASGFPDPQWFRRLFVRQNGVSPRTWRRLHSRIHTNTR